MFKIWLVLTAKPRVSRRDGAEGRARVDCPAITGCRLPFRDTQLAIFCLRAVAIRIA